MNQDFKPRIEGDGVYEEIYGNLRKKITIIYIVGWLIVTIVEVVFGIILLTMHKSLDPLNYYLIYVLLPAGIDACIITVTLLLIRVKKIPAVFKNYIIITSLVLIALVLSTVHSTYPVVLALFVIPVLVTSVFLEYRFLLYSLITSTIGLTISAVINIYTEWADKKLHLVANASISFMIMMLFSFISWLIILVHKNRERTLSQVQTENAKLSKETRFDGLTGLQNHTSFYTVLENKLVKARHNKTGFALAMLDIDDFKDVNDTYGHAAGDEILKFVSETLVNVIGKSGAVFRYGGDEFAIIFHNPDPDANVQSLEHIRMVVESNDTMLMNGSGITLSIGYYNVKEAIMSSEEIFYRTDQALYQAKYNGKNQVYAVF